MFFLCLTPRCAARLFALVIAAAVVAGAAYAAEPQVELKPGDRICFIGSGLGERMQHFNHFETLLHARFPEHKLVVRNLCWSADELTLRPRSQDFGSPDDHLTRQQTDVIFAFFGFNESYAGPAGLPKFESDLKSFIESTKGKKYNGKSAPRLVLISPIAHEDLRDPNLPDGKADNENLKLYTAAMQKVAAAGGVGFVDLFTPTLAAFADQEHHTFNGVHLTDAGDRMLAPVLDESLFGSPSKLKSGTPAYEKLRAEIAEKSTQFFYRYRAVNGFYIYGGRSPLWNNKAVMENERAMLDDMCANRDQRIWAVAQGKAVPAEIDDSNVRPHLDVPTNYPNKITLLNPDEAEKQFTVAEGYQVSLFASEREFPELGNAVQFAFDSRGRLWIAVMPSYPQYQPLFRGPTSIQPPTRPNDKVLILEDVDRDGRADKCTTFADGLHVPTGLELGHGGAYVAQQPNLMFLKDTDGDDKADVREIVLHGFDSADSHHSISAFTWGPGGDLYFQEGTFHHTQVETPYGPVRCKDAGVFRYEPRTQKLSVFVSYGFANPWGHVFDRWGQNFVADASGGANYVGAAFSGYIDYPHKHGGMKQFLTKRFRPTCGCEFITSRHFPENAQGRFLLNNCIGQQGVYQHVMKDEGSGFAATEIEPLLESTDRNFRPVDLKFGLDGALYVVDWHNPLVGHMQHSLRDPNRDHAHGRIWRITAKDRPLLMPPKIDGATIPELFDLLKTYEDRVRYAVRQELGGRDTAAVLAALKTWVAGLDKNDAEYQHHLLEALWVQQNHNSVDEAFLTQMLHSPEPKARAAATRVLCYSHHRVADPLALLEPQVNDEHPRVRLEAVRALSFFTDKDQAGKAAELAAAVALYDMDDYLNYTLNETVKQLERRMK